jgi:ATP-dependent helicase/nuclease subunit B
MAERGPRVRSIAPHLPFADTLAAELLARVGDDPLALARMLILVPNRRAARALADAFLRQSDGKATLLPRIQALGDPDEDEALLLEPDLDLPPAIDPLTRAFLLIPLVQAWLRSARKREAGAAEALRLAQALGQVLDRCAYAEVSPDQLDAVVPAELSSHWQQSRTFLDIVLRAWPALLTERGAMDPPRRRVILLACRAACHAHHCSGIDGHCACRCAAAACHRAAAARRGGIAWA